MFIFNFKKIKNYIIKLKPVIISLIIITVIELLIFIFLFQEKTIKKTNYHRGISYKFMQAESQDVEITIKKLNILGKEQFDILIIGDSTGLNNLNPLIFNNTIPNTKTINLATIYSVGWNGFKKILLYNLRYNKKLKFVVLSITPHTLTNQIQNYKNYEYINNKIEDNYFSNWRLINSLPSLTYKFDIISFTYQKIFNFDHTDYDFLAKFYFNNIKNNYKNTEYNFDLKEFFYKYIYDNLGWLPLNLIKKENNFGKILCHKIKRVKDASFNEKIPNLTDIQEINKIVKKNNLKLSVIINPSPCVIKNIELGINNKFQEFKFNNQDIFIPFELYYNMPNFEFVDEVHLIEDSANIFSNKVANVLKKNFFNN